jgi:hypothetical protein
MIVDRSAAALSSRRQDLIDQPIVRCFERIDKSNSCQFKAILEVPLHRERRSVLPHRRSAHAEGGRQPSYRPASNPAHASLYGSRNRNLLTPDCWNTPA